LQELHDHRTQQGLPPRKPNRDEVGFWLRRLSAKLEHMEGRLQGAITAHNMMVSVNEQVALQQRGIRDTLNILRNTLIKKGAITEDDLQETYREVCESLGVAPREMLVDETYSAIQKENITETEAPDGSTIGSDEGSAEVSEPTRENIH
jgi:hypothetical protein